MEQCGLCEAVSWAVWAGEMLYAHTWERANVIARYLLRRTYVAKIASVLLFRWRLKIADEDDVNCRGV